MTTTARPTTRPDTQAGDLELLGIERRFGTSIALNGVDLRVPAGSLTVIVGPSGCGKSTLLRILAGLDGPTTGRLLASGADVTDAPVGRRDIAMVFQDYALFPHMSVERNISFGMRLARRHDRTDGPTRGEITERTQEVAARFGIDDLLDRRPADLSGGQRQRVALARAVVRRPQVLLLDEPLSALDVALRADARAELLRLHRDLGTTLVLVTHDQHEALSLATHLVVMDRGRVVQSGPPQDVYRRPATVFVAGFVGSPRMNLWTDGDETVGWRPSDARWGPCPTGSGLDIAGTVDVCEFTGAGQELHSVGDAGPFVLLQGEGEAWLRPGDGVHAHVPASAVHRFGPDGTRTDG
ncbi:ABC transporter ATP-binding protein [Nocardioides sp.]|uniref:ABC transporter ATP-binding protein n=1 Tax=Nocardioides sp. TaxID=35761 RepID=UPI0019B2727A|nr:ABC transporter ATP-binding protein [Nocardioides sp.]MBC7277294.1 ABC transporter ATP-binding protein [Nocardioides sp.]